MDEDIKEKIKKHDNRGTKAVGYIASIAVNIALVYIFNNLPSWHWLKESFVVPLWIFNLSFVATILVNILYLTYDKKWFISLCQIPLNIISIIAIYTLYIIFPFSVNDQIAKNIHLAIIVVMVCIGIALITELIKFLYNFIRFLSGHNEK